MLHWRILCHFILYHDCFSPFSRWTRHVQPCSWLWPYGTLDYYSTGHSLSFSRLTTTVSRLLLLEKNKQNSFDFPQLSLCTLSLCHDFLHFPEWLLSNRRACARPWCFCAHRQSSSKSKKVRFYSKEKVGASPPTWTETSAAVHSGLLRLLYVFSLYDCALYDLLFDSKGLKPKHLQTQCSVMLCTAGKSSIKIGGHPIAK